MENDCSNTSAKKLEQRPMKNDKFALLGAAIAGIVTVASSSGRFDLTDTAIGLVLILMVWPVLATSNTKYEKLLISVVFGLCLLLVAGVFVEILGPKIWPGAKHQSLHFLVWLDASALFFVLIPAFKRMTEQIAHKLA